MAQKSNPLPNDQKIVFIRIKACQLDLYVKLKYEATTIILFIGIRYSMHDLPSDLSINALPANWRHASDTVNDVSASSGIGLP